MRIDFMYLDLETCTRCRGADRNLEAALDAARGSLVAVGTDVEVNRLHVTSAEQARELRFVSSPTLRVNGHDVALELRESPCGSEPCSAGCGDEIDCRVWVHDGHEHTEPPVEMILEAILREARRPQAGAPGGGADPFELPENLERFFAANKAPAAGQEPADHGAASECCPPAELRDCCDPADKAECCGAGAGSCGCR